jgi:hypothetical protein
MANERTRGFPVEPRFNVRPNLDPNRYSQVIADPIVQNQQLANEYNDFNSYKSVTPFIPTATSPHFLSSVGFSRLTNYCSFWFANYYKSTNTELFVPNLIKITVNSTNKSGTIYHTPGVTPLTGSLTGIQYTSFQDDAVFSYNGDDVKFIDFEFYYNYKLPQVLPVYPAAAPASDWGPYIMIQSGYVRGLKGFYITKS